jgi:putative ABC transport system permease protein
VKKSRLTILSGELRDSVAMALAAVAAHKLRSVLTLLGVLVGVFSIIAVMTALRVMEGRIETQISQLGSQTLMIRKWPAIFFSRPEGIEKIRRRKNLTLRQCQQVQEKSTRAASIGIQSSLWSGEVQTGRAGSSPEVQLLGETPGSFSARNWNLAEGRILADVDVAGARDVCVLGHSLATNLFPSASPLGERVKIDGINYLVVGLLESQGASLSGDQDNFAVIPITTGLNRYGNDRRRTLDLLVQAPNAAGYEACREEAQGLMRAVRKVAPGDPDDFEILSNDSMITQFNSFTLVLRLGVALISSVALLAAGVGIMNIMLVSVTERTREIGIRRAIGAKKRSIMAQFILEAVVLCELGGAIGVALGILGGNGAAWYFHFPPAIPFDWVVIGLAICSAVGVIFGSYPAWKAANLDPIESLRYE